MGEPLTSTQNALVKRAASLRLRKFRDREGAFLVEGADLVVAGLAAGRRPQVVFVRAEQADGLVGLLGLSGAGERRRTAGAPAAGPAPAVYPVNERVAAKISTLGDAPDVLAIFPLPERRLPISLLAGRGQADRAPSADAGLLVVYADGIQDPGNLGTLLRAAVAFGATALVTSPGSADLYGPKTLRAGMGAVFGLPLFAERELAEVVRDLAPERVYGLAAHGGAALAGVGLRRPAVLVVGSERQGLSEAAREAVTDLVTIPLAPAAAGAVESLNAGVAGAIALYEFSRQGAAAEDAAPSASPPTRKET